MGPHGGSRWPPAAAHQEKHKRGYPCRPAAKPPRTSATPCELKTHGPGKLIRLGSMPGRIRQEDIAAVRERSLIADVIGEYLQLRPAGGGNLKGLCPFHQERTPSFNVTPGKELYHCFSCGEGGDVIKFVMQMEQLQFGQGG